MITPGQRLSFLQQDHFKYDAYPVLDTVIMGNSRLYEIMKEKEAIYAKEDFTDEDGIRASELEGEFAEMNGWEAESDAATLLNGLGIEQNSITHRWPILQEARKSRYFWLRHFLETRTSFFWMSLLTTWISLLLNGWKNS